MLTDTMLRALRPRDRLYRVAGANGLCIEVAPAFVSGALMRLRIRDANPGRRLCGDGGKAAPAPRGFNPHCAA